MAADARLQGIEAEEAMKRALTKIPMGRMAEPEDIARVVLFLASDAASYVTGINMSMDGATSPLVI
jgi:NAD(P)-dependent dehydrogenase (short-subunit alcohol dehydrogenase family)